MMYSMAVLRDLIAQHYLIGGDWGAENELHSHHYVVALQVEGDTLDQHGYLVDIVDVESHLDSLIQRYADRTLNDLPEFEGLNPSIENFARILCTALEKKILAQNIHALSVRIWENDIAWASYRLER